MKRSKMNSKHRKTLKSIFTKPIPSNIRWKDVEALFTNLGAKITEGNESRVRVQLYDREMTFHRPHPKNESEKGAIKEIRLLLEKMGIYDDEI